MSEEWPKPKAEEIQDSINLEKQNKFDQLSWKDRQRMIDEAKRNAEWENLERELSPEVIDKMMEKVQDIFEYGTAYTSVTGRQKNNEFDEESERKLASILKSGLLGRDWERNKNKGAVGVDEWKKDVKERSNPVHFNIVGRTLAIKYGRPDQYGFKDSEPEKAGKPFPRLKGFHKEYPAPYIIFDISSFRELDPIFHEYDVKGLSRTFRINGPKDEMDMTPDSHGKPGAGAEFGFQLSHRLPPRFIKGIAVNYSDDALNIVKVMKKIFHNPEMMLPIYQVDHWEDSYAGNESNPIETMDDYNKFIKKESKFSLIWPKKMSYEEVKKFIAERDKGKKEKNKK